MAVDSQKQDYCNDNVTMSKQMNDKSKVTKSQHRVRKDKKTIVVEVTQDSHNSLDDTILRLMSYIAFSLFSGLFILQACYVWNTYKNFHCSSSTSQSELISSEIFVSGDRMWKLDYSTGQLRVNTTYFVC